jgi:hypothetical protein
MKRAHMSLIALLVICLAVFAPALVYASPDTAPPVGAPLVREGALAVKLAAALGLGAGMDEAAAESRLGDMGISPRNGWIADYPVTPDITGELQQAVIDAADNSRLPMGRDEALKKFYDASMELGLSVVPYADDSIRQSSSEDYPAQTTVNNYYYSYGPPVVTYYAPPPDYVYLYAWVPFPFWSWGFWFPGFYVLHDFHKTVVIDRRVVYVSNHYSGPGHRKVYVVDPVKRHLHTGTVYGIGVPHNRTIVYRGNPGVARRVIDMNAGRGRQARPNTGASQPPAPAVRPAAPDRDKGRPAGAPARMERNTGSRNDGDRKAFVQPVRTDNAKPVPPKRDGQEARMRPLLKSIESRPARAGKGTGTAGQNIGVPPPLRNNAGQAAALSANKGTPQHEGRGAVQGRPQPGSEGRARAEERKASPPAVRGAAGGGDR